MKIRIESDGKITKVYRDGVEIKHGTQILFCAVPGKAICYLEEYEVNENGCPIVKNNDLVTKMHLNLFSEGDNE